MRLLDVVARRFEQLRVVHARRARGLAGKAAEAVTHLVGKRARHRELLIGHRAHQRNAAAWTVPLVLRFVVGRAGGQAHAAVHALLDDGVVEGPERAGHDQSKIFPG